MATTAINVPITLQIQNLQSLVGDLQKQLSNLKVGSAGFNNVQKIITSIRSEIDRLSVQTAKPFINASQFTKAENSVDKLEDKINEVTLSIQKIKFGDLELTSGQKADLQAFEDSINSIKDKLKAVKQSVKDDFLKSDQGQKWREEFDATAMTKSLDKITAEVARATNDQKQKFEELQKVAVDYQKALSESQRIKDFTDKMVDDPSNGTDLFSKKWQELTQKLTNGKIQFKTGGKTLMVQWLESQLKLDHGALDSLLRSGISANNIGQKLRELLNDQLNKNQSFISDHSGAEQAAESAKAKYEELDAILQRVGLSEQQIAQVTQALSSSLRQTEQSAQSYKESLVSTAQKEMDVSNTASAMKSQLDSLRNTLTQTNTQFLQMQRTQQSFSQMKMAIVNFMGFNQVLNLTKRAVKEAMNHIKELDSVMNKISIVTDMSTGDLWGQIDQYSKMAQSYGVSIKGAYEVSQIYYQQGLDTANVMTLTNETLKLAKISGLDYAQTTDYMTTALRGFKMEMSEAGTVVDVYSNLAAHTAVSQEELAVAMSKTASSMEGVGSTFQESSAMIATMVAVTRESATNIGSAMKSIASRYGELTKDPTKLVDEDGEAMAFNKVDAALQSVGISMKTVDGQFREFTDVIVELGEKWSELDSTQQRYIATQFAGNRQQSRFLALVSNVDLLKSNLNYAENSEDVGTLQALKALDSVEAKLEQVKVAYQQFYTTIGAENVWKGLLDGTTNVINTLNSLPKLFGKIPIGAIAAITSIVSVIKNLGLDMLTTFSQMFGSSIMQGALQAASSATEGAHSLIGMFINAVKGKKSEAEAAGKEIAEATAKGMTNSSTINQTQYNNNQKILDSYNNAKKMFGSSSLGNEEYLILAQSMKALPVDVLEKIIQNEDQAKQILEEFIGGVQRAQTEFEKLGSSSDQTSSKFKTFINNHKNLSQGLQSFGSALNMIAMTINTTSEGGKTLSGVFQGIAGAAMLAGAAVKMIDSQFKTIPWMAIASGILTVINALSTLIVTPEEKLEELSKKAEDLSNAAKQAKAEYNTLDRSIKKLDELKEKRYESAEAAEEYQTAVDELAEKFPQMIAGFDAAGNVILDTTDAEAVLAEARKKSKEATYEAAEAELQKAKEQRNQAKSKVTEALGRLDMSEYTVTQGEEIASAKRRKYFSTKTIKLDDSEKQILGLSGVDDYFQGIVYDAISTGTELTDEQLLDGIKAYNDVLKTLGSQAYSFIDNFAGETIQDLYEYMQTYKSSHKNNLSVEFFEIEQLVNTNLSESIETSYSDVITELNTLENMSVDDAGFEEQILKVKQAIHNYQQFFNEEDAEFTRFQVVIDALGDVSKLTSEFISSSELYKGNQKAVVSAWQQSEEANREAWNILESSANAAAMVTKQIIKNIGEEDYDKVKSDQTRVKQWKEYQRNMASFIEGLSPDNLELFNRMTMDTVSFSAKDIIDTFNIKENNPVYQYVIDYYSDGVKSIQTRLNASLAKSLGKTELVDGTYDQITEEDVKGRSQFYQDYYKLISEENKNNLAVIDEQILSETLQQYDKLKEAGYGQRAEIFGSAALSLYQEISKQPYDIQKTLWSIISENGLSSLEAIQKIRDAIENAGIKSATADTALDNLENNIIPKLNLEIQTMTDNLLNTWEDTSKELSKAMSGGLTLSEADSLITKAKSIGVELDINKDFVQNGDKLLLTASAFNEYWTKLDALSSTESEKMQNYIKEAEAILGRATNFDLLSQDDKAIIEALIPNFDWTKYTDESGRELTTEGIEELAKAIVLSKKRLSDYNEYARIAAEQIKNSSDWAEGNYKSYSTDIEELRKLASGEIKLNKTDYNAKAVKENINNVYSTLISDILSKGWKDINLEDYEGLISQEGQRVIQDSELQGSYVQFVRKYADFTGKSISEINNLLAQAMEKDNESRSVALLKDLTFFDETHFGTSLTGLKDFASKVGLKLDEVLAKAVVSANQDLDQYVVDMSIIKSMGANIELDTNSMRATIQDSVNTFWTDLTKLITDGISGGLSNVQVGTLSDSLQKLGYFGKVDFTKTNKGLKLTRETVFEIYNTLKQVNKYQAQQMLPEITKMSDQYGTLEKVCQRYNTLIRSNTKELQIEKQALDDLIKSMLTTPESYNFLSNKLPQDLQLTSTYAQNIESSYKKIEEAAKNGFMSVADFYNIVDMTMTVRPDFQIDGLNGAQIKEKIYDNLIWKNDTLSVDLSSKGLGFDSKDLWNLYAELRNGLEYMSQQAEAYQTIGRKLTTAQNALSTIGPFDFSKLFKSDSDDLSEDGQEYINQLKELANSTMPELADVLKTIQISGKSLYDTLFADNFNLQNTGFSKEGLTQFLSQLSQIEFDPNTIASQIQDLIDGKLPDLVINTGVNSYLQVTSNGIVNVDLSDPKLKKKVIDAYNEFIKEKGGTSANKDNIITLLQDAWSKASGDNPLEVDANTRYVIGLASGEIDASSIVKKDGKWTGTYDGKVFTGKDKQAVIDAIGRAMALKDAGFSFEWNEESGFVKINKQINKKVNIQLLDDGYHATGPNGEDLGNAPTEEELLNKLTQAGWNDRVGTNVTLEDGTAINVIQHQGVTISHYVDNDGQSHWVYEGRDFTSYKDFTDYVNLIETYGGNTEGNIVKDGKEDIQIGFGGKVHVTKDANGIDVGWSINGQECSKEQFDDWVKASSDLSATDFTFNKDTGESSFAYYIDSLQVKVNYNNGQLSYEVDLGNGDKITANSEAGIRAGIAMNTRLTGGEISEGDGNTKEPVSYTLHKGGAKVTVVYGADGTPEIDKNTANSQLKEDVAKELENNPVTSDADVPAEATVNAVNISLGENPTVNLIVGENGLKVTNPLVSVSADTNQLQITPTEITALLNNLMPHLSGTLQNAKYLGDFTAILTQLSAQYSGKPTDTSAIALEDFSYADAIAAILSTILLTTNESTKPDFSSVTVNDENFTLDQILSAMISQLEINGDNVTTKKGTITLGENQNEISIGELIGIVSTLLLQWAEGASKEPDYEKLGLPTSYTAPPAQVIQKIKAVWQLDNEGEELDNLAAEITELLGSVDFSTDSKTGHIVLAIDESDITLPKDFDVQGLITNIRQKIQEYISKGGTKYQFDQFGNVIDLTAELDTTTMDSTIESYTKTPEVLPTSFDTPDTKLVDNFKPKTKIIPTALGTPGEVTGNVSLAHGNAKAGGTPTLMGELGPELVVSHGRYFVVGQGGAEMVNLADDAIVFNHIQTRQLLTNGKTGRGQPKTNEYTAAGMVTGNVSGGPARGYTPSEHGDSGLDKKTEGLLEGLTTEKKSKLASLISDLIAKGFDNIDWEQIQKDLGAELTEKLKADAKKGNLREFVKKYGEYCDKTIKEINELYFQAWQKDLEAVGESEELLGAIEGLTFFGNGSVGGSASDWTTLFGNKVKITDLVSQGLVEWDSALRQYIVKDWDTLVAELKKAGVDIDNEQIQALKEDSVKAMVSSIADLLEKAVEGTLTSSELNTLNSYLKQNGLSELSKEFLTQTADGWIVSLKGIRSVMQNVANNTTLTTTLKTKLTATLNDTLQSTMESIADIIASAVEGSLKGVDLNSLNAFLSANGIAPVTVDSLTRTVDGLKMSTAEAARLYSSLKSIDDIAAQITLNKLIEGLKESDDHYKTMSSTLARIKELQEQIAKYEKVNSAKAEQYKKELQLAREIAAIRATTDDDSMNFLDQALPQGFNNPLNYINSWITGLKSLRDAAGTDGSGIMDFKSLYNMAQEVNKQAAAAGKSITFLGHTFDGAATTLQSFATKMAQALGSSKDGTFGVLLGKLGADLKTGTDSYATDADEAMKQMAKTQIAILDELITYFEGIVALEALGDIDKNLDGILDLSEIFKKNGKKNANGAFEFQKTTIAAIKTILEKVESNSDIKSLAKGIKVGKYSLYRIIKDMEDGLGELDLTAEQYKDVLNALYKMVSEGDFDLSNLPQALREQFSKYFDGIAQKTIDLGDKVLNLDYNITISKNDDGTWTATDGKKYKTKEEAMRASIIYELDPTGKNTTDKDGKATITKYIGTSGYKAEYVVDDKGNVTYWYKGHKYTTLDELYSAIYNAQKDSDGFEYKNEAEWRKAQGLPDKATQTGKDTWTFTPGTTTKLKIGNKEIEVTTTSDADGKKKYKYGRKSYDSLEKLYKAIFNDDESKKDGETFDEWKIRMGITAEVTPSITFKGEALSDTSIAAIMGKTYAEMKAAWESNKVGFKATFGFEWDESTTQAEWDEFIKSLGIEDKKYNLTINLKSFNIEDGAFTDDAKKAIRDLLGIGEEGLSLDLTGDALDNIKDIEDLLKRLKGKEVEVKLTGGAIDDLETIISQLNSIIGSDITIRIKDTTKKGEGNAKGNVALAAGRTLMGELGPELVVSNGKYYTVGNNGAEFVDLPKDAIVFNHLQTKRLLTNGNSGRGTPAVSEVAAVSMAAGNALASAAETLATLKTLRAMWQSLADSSLKDLIGTTTSSGDSGSSSRTGAWLAQVERWYDLLQKIARLEKQINTYEAERNALQSSQYTDGKRLFELDQATLNNYKEQGAAQKQLAEEYKERFEVRRKELNATAMSQFYTYDEYGQLKFDKEGFAKLQSIRYQTDEGKTLSPIQQFELFNKYTGGAFDKYSKLDSSGLLIEREEDETDESYYKRRVEAGWERIEAEKTELQELWDAYNESTQKYYDAINKGNEVLNRILDNQRELEDKVLDAIEKREQAAIDALSKEREALSKSTESYIKGLSDALTKERSMYEKSDNATELNKLRRQLNILQRSGGSASQIADLQSQISQKDREAYFDAQQDSIDAVQDASDLQLEKMQNQIDLMTETLEYQKANGLLWEEVNDIMKHDSEYITDFITGNDDSWLSKSTLAQQQELNTLNSSVQQWIGYRDQADETMRTSMTDGFQAVVDEFRALHPIISAAGELGDSDSKNPYIHEGDYNYNPATAGSKSSGSDSTGTGTGQQLTLADYQGKKEESKATEYKAEGTLEVRYKNKEEDANWAGWSSLRYSGVSTESKSKAANSVKDDLHDAIIDLLKTFGYLEYKTSDGGWAEYKTGHGAGWTSAVKDSIVWTKFALGGDVNYTGPAMLHGTELHPETVLSAPATQQWKTEITGKRNTSLMSRLAELGNVLAGIEKVSNSHIDKETDSSISIENASVNMYVDQIANDYDARRAGNQALEKILEVARKSNGNNRIGR